MNNINELYDQWLVEYQPDLQKILTKHRFSPKHAISVEEILSEVNFRLIKDKNKLIKDKVIDFISFKKMAYSYARNLIKWTADGVSSKDKKYFNNRSDGIVRADDGDKTVFEYICETLGNEDEVFNQMYAPQKIENLKKWIFNYSHFLSEHQKNVLTFVFKGEKLYEIAEVLGVTHQAISALVDDSLDRIKSYFKPDVLLKSEKEIIQSGRESINFLFGPERKMYRSQFDTRLKTNK